MYSKLIRIISAVFLLASITAIPVNADISSDLIDAAAVNDLAAAQASLEKGADVNAKTFYFGETALMLAAEKDAPVILKAILDAGANVNAKNNVGETTLMYAAKKGNIELVQVLLNKSANVNAKDNNGWTALMYAAFMGNRKTARLLKKSGARDIPAWVKHVDKTLLDKIEEHDDIKDALPKIEIAYTNDIHQKGLLKGNVVKKVIAQR